jgi:uncharacterized protein
MSELGQVGHHASSRDARTFTFSALAATPLVVGALVVVRTLEGTPYLGQILEQDASAGSPSDRLGGQLITALGEDGGPHRGALKPFDDAAVEQASSHLIELLQASRGADLTIGGWESAGTDAPARLRAQGFGRHTFLCGQSGSGKTYALGVILEQLLLGTDLRMVVLDPNADYVRLAEPRPDAPDDAGARLRALDAHILGARTPGSAPLLMRFATMPREAQAAIMRLDPLTDREEYNTFVHFVQSLAGVARAGGGEVDQVVARLTQGGAVEQALAQRMENLGLVDWEVWARDRQSAAEVVASGARLTVLDLSGFRTPQEPLAVSLDLIENLWAQRETRTPTLIVIDEAHNICPAEPQSSIHHALVERLTQIAAEGRKYGLWLLLSTQRPSKIAPQVLSQCDNLALMRMNSPADIAELGEVFGFAPTPMLRASRYFTQGEALMAGIFVPVPGIVRMGARLTPEGGSDVSVPTAAVGGA